MVPLEWRRALREVEPGEGEAPGGAVCGDPPVDRFRAGVGEVPTALDLVIERRGLPSRQVAAARMILELRGLGRQPPGQRYVRR